MSTMVFDYDDFMDRVEHDKELAVDLVEIFLEDAPDRVRAISDAIESGDPDAINRAAHALKGAAANLSAHYLRNLAYRIETAARQGDMEAAKSLFLELETAYVTLTSELRNKVLHSR